MRPVFLNDKTDITLSSSGSDVSLELTRESSITMAPSIWLFDHSSSTRLGPDAVNLYSIFPASCPETGNSITAFWPEGNMERDLDEIGSQPSVPYCFTKKVISNPVASSYP